MNNFRKELGLSDKQTVLGSTSWDDEKKNTLSNLLNNHGLLDNYDSCQMLGFLGGDEHLREVLKLRTLLKKYGEKTLALDIDETLSATSRYWFARLLELFGNPENLTPEQMVRKYYHAKNVPYWKGNTDVLEYGWVNIERMMIFKNK